MLYLYEIAITFSNGTIFQEEYLEVKKNEQTPILRAMREIRRNYKDLVIQNINVKLKEVWK